MYTLLYLKWITNKFLLYNTGTSAQCYVAAWMGGELVGEWVHVYFMAEFHCSPETMIQFSSVAQSCPPLCNPMDCSMPGLPVHQHLPEFTQTHIHRVSDAI